LPNYRLNPLGKSPLFLERLALGISLPPAMRELTVSTAGQPDLRLQLKLPALPTTQKTQSKRSAKFEGKAKDFPNLGNITTVFLRL
jgi:hypothetical protein